MSERLSPRCGTRMCTRVGAGTLARDLFGKQVFEFFAIFEIYRDIEIARDVGLANVELLEQGGEKFAGMNLFGLLLLMWGRRIRPSAPIEARPGSVAG